LNAECLFSDPTKIINIACVVKFGVAFFKSNIRRFVCKIVSYNRFFNQITVSTLPESVVISCPIIFAISKFKNCPNFSRLYK
jgi:hypothetical protein